MATLTVTHTEDLTLNGVQQGTTNTLSISSIDGVYKRIVTVAAGVDTTVLNFEESTNVTAAESGPSVGGTLHVDQVKYVRITNLEGSNGCAINIIGDMADDDEDGTEEATDGIVALQLKAGHSLVLGEPKDMLQVADNAITILNFAALENIQRMVCEGGSNAIQLEIFVAIAFP